jgi:hypothetical protein
LEYQLLKDKTYTIDNNGRGAFAKSLRLWVSIFMVSNIAVATAVRTRMFLWGREAPPQKHPKKSGYSYKKNVGLRARIILNRIGLVDYASSFEVTFGFTPDFDDWVRQS